MSPSVVTKQSQVSALRVTFGRTFEPLGLGTWAIPIVLLGLGALLLPVARRLTTAAWLLATQENPPLASDPSARARARQEATA